MKGLFITFEGGEGAGKSTMMDNVINWFSQRGHSVVRTREPGGTQTAEKIREILLDREHEQLDGLAELLLVFAARAQNLAEVIRPALDAGQTVICDRFTDATWAYQGGGRGLNAADISSLEQLVHGDLQPDLTLLLDLPVAQGMDRAAGRGTADRFEAESLRFFSRVRQAYLARAEHEASRFAIIDASHDIDGVWQQIQHILQERFA